MFRAVGICSSQTFDALSLKYCMGRFHSHLQTYAFNVLPMYLIFSCKQKKRFWPCILHSNRNQKGSNQVSFTLMKVRKGSGKVSCTKIETRKCSGQASCTPLKTRIGSGQVCCAQIEAINGSGQASCSQMYKIYVLDILSCHTFICML